MGRRCRLALASARRTHVDCRGGAAKGRSMDFVLSDEHRMLKELVARFVADALVPLEPKVLERESRGEGAGLTEAERRPIDAKARELGLWGLDAPAEFG